MQHTYKNSKKKLYFKYMLKLFQDIETGLAGTGTIPTEEAICILVSSYKSSEMSQDVHNEVALLSNKVHYMANY